MAKTAPAKRSPRPRPPKIVRIAVRVALDEVIELGGKRFRLDAPGPLRPARQALVVDADTWASLSALPRVAALLAAGQLEVI